MNSMLKGDNHAGQGRSLEQDEWDVEYEVEKRDCCNKQGSQGKFL